MAEEMRNYNSDIMINPNNLEDEILTQPSLYVTYMELFADYSYKKDVAKARLEYIEADLAIKIRTNPHEYDFDGKPTEGAIKNKILLDETYQKKLNELHELTKKVNIYSGMKTAFEQRRKSLDNLVALKIGGFHSDVKAFNKKAKNESMEQNRTEQKETLNQNKRLVNLKTKIQK